MDTQAAPQLDVQGLALLIGVFIPVLVAAITKKYSAPWVKSVTNLVAVGVGAVVALLLQDGTDVTFWQVVNALIATYIASIAAYKGLWKPLNVGNIAPASGLGNRVSINEQPGAYDTSGTPRA
jgi:uncharacterized membrane protein (DUF441 family)